MKRNLAIDRRQSPRHVQVRLAAQARPRYRTFNLTAGALFAIELAQYAAVARYGRPACKPAAE